MKILQITNELKSSKEFLALMHNKRNSEGMLKKGWKFLLSGKKKIIHQFKGEEFVLVFNTNVNFNSSVAKNYLDKLVMANYRNSVQ